jgi:hypothetical protein
MANRKDVVRRQAMSGKAKTPLTTEEQAQITTMAAGGVSQNRIAKTIGRSRHMVKNTLAEPEVIQAVELEKAELAELYRDKARAVLVSINDADIEKASLQQKSVSTGILLDKALLLSEGPPVFDVHILLDIAAMVRGDKQGLPNQPAPLLLSPPKNEK